MTGISKTTRAEEAFRDTAKGASATDETLPDNIKPREARRPFSRLPVAAGGSGAVRISPPVRRLD